MKLSAIIVVVVAAAAATVASAAAANAADTTPSVTIQAVPGFSVPGNTALQRSPTDPNWYAGFTATWTVSAPAGVCHQTITQSGYSIDPDGGTQTQTLPNSARSFNFSESGYNNGRGQRQLQIDVTDCNGVTATSGLASVNIVYGVEDTDKAVTYTGNWLVSKFTGFSDGTTHYSTKAGARADIAFQTTASEPVGVAMERASNRGAATIYLDGKKKKVVDTYSSTTAHHQVVWSTRLSAGKHVVGVVNNGTTGRSRIDFDLLPLEYTSSN